MASKVIRRYTRTVTALGHKYRNRGRKDEAGNAVVESENLGYYATVDLDAGGISFRVGDNPPKDEDGNPLLKVGQEVVVTLAFK